MKKILLSIAIVLTMSFGAKAQFGITDAFFNDWETSRSLELVMPGLPFMHGETGDVSAPLGGTPAVQDERLRLPLVVS